ncbi:hypothetical protein Sme01_02780 [Sphaerisporangium melleum]|uniref:Uncharacterized protein n=1 Tax=Sphaerisporangium melleum TaxID=321316 RepID=A0A917QP71_9ACTN|nr:hypothetical protein [Sphaerisporangium melleum]GGK61136.1 hypothetical protein GCM10007964_00320 [Sphaerisporangium melleum]GII67802.1 hypothetical protein Sme01_02780 [Sphaerisporangium melleum]
MATYTVETNGNISLSAATAKTILAAINGSRVIKATELSVSFDGASPTAVPVTVELCSSTQATAGTTTSHTPAQVSGATRSLTAATAARNYTVEPTVLTVLKRWLVHPQGGLLAIQFPLGREPQKTVSGHALSVRVTAPATVNVQGYLEFTEDE